LFSFRVILADCAVGVGHIGGRIEREIGLYTMYSVCYMYYTDHPEERLIGDVHVMFNG